MADSLHFEFMKKLVAGFFFFIVVTNIVINC